MPGLHRLPGWDTVRAMTLYVEPVPILSDNYAWLLRDGGAMAMVDPADADACIAAVERTGGRLDMVLITHHHGDHVAGVDAVRARFDCPVVGATADAHRLPRLDRMVAEGDEVTLGGSVLRVLETPGHTVGHIAYAGGGVALCGDTLFSLGCGRLLEGTAVDMFNSLQKLAALDGDTLVCCGHEYTQANARFALHVDAGNAALQARAAEVDRLRAARQATVPSRLRDELQANPFLRAPDAGKLGQLRSQKDTFR